MKTFLLSLTLLIVSIAPLSAAKENDLFLKALHEVDFIFKHDVQVDAKKSVYLEFLKLEKKNPETAKKIADFWVNKALHANDEAFTRQIKDHAATDKSLLVKLMERHIQFYMFDNWDKLGTMISSNLTKIN